MQQYKPSWVHRPYGDDFRNWYEKASRGQGVVFAECASPLWWPLLRTNTFSTISSSTSIPILYLPIFLFNRQTFPAWSPVSQWLQHWAFPLFVPLFFFSSFESLENAGQWLTGILECLATQGLCRRKWAVSVCGSVSMATKIKNEKKAPAQSCWDVLEMRNSLSTFSLMACGSTAQGPAALALMFSSSQRLSLRLQCEITAPLQHILAWLGEVALLTDHSFRAFYVSMGSRWWGWLTGSEYQLYL